MFKVWSARSFIVEERRVVTQCSYIQGLVAVTEQDDVFEVKENETDEPWVLLGCLVHSPNRYTQLFLQNVLFRGDVYRLERGVYYSVELTTADRDFLKEVITAWTEGKYFADMT
jgi:hypothetical protein